MYAFENTWHVVGLVCLLAAARGALSRAPARARYRPAALEALDSLLVAVLLVFCILRPFVVQSFFIPSGSMLPTLREGDRILVNKLVYLLREPRVGEIIVFDAPPQASAQKRDFVKRVVGTPGDSVCVMDHRLIRNETPVDEPYVLEAPLYTWPADARAGARVRVPADGLLVLGDNRNASHDGHQWELVRPDGEAEAAPFLPRANVRGRAMAVFWPPGRIGLLR